jgi:CBS domain-containing protein
MTNMLLFSLISLLALDRCSSFSMNNDLISSSSSQQHQQRVFVSTPARSSNKIVSDLMTSQPNLLVLTPHTPVDEAISALLQAGVSGAPVAERMRDAEHPERKATLRLVGFVSSFDFLPREESGTLVMLGDADNEDSETARRILGGEVRDVMTRDPITVTTNDPMKVAAETMARYRRVLMHGVFVIVLPFAQHNNFLACANLLIRRRTAHADLSHFHPPPPPPSQFPTPFPLVFVRNATRLHALPVVDAKHGNLVGIVTAKDVMRDVMKIANKALPGEDAFSQSMINIPEFLPPPSDDATIGI